MIKFILGIIFGIFLIPVIKEVIFQIGFKQGIQDIFKHPIDFIKEIVNDIIN